MIDISGLFIKTINNKNNATFPGEFKINHGQINRAVLQTNKNILLYNFNEIATTVDRIYINI